MNCKCGDEFISKANIKVSIQSATEFADEVGGRSTTWSELHSVWAHVEPMGGKEMFLSAQLQSKVDARLTIRFKSDLSDTTTAAKLRVTYKGRVFNIKAVKNLADDLKSEGTAFQQMFCVEGEPS